MTVKYGIHKCYTSRRLVIAIFVLALFLGGAGYIKYADVSAGYGDALEYEELGKEVASGSWVTSKEFGKIRTPGYPIILGGIYAIFREGAIYVKVVQVIMFSITAILIFYLGEILFNRFVGLLSAVWYITYYDFIRTSYILLRETWTTFFILLALLSLVLYFKSPKMWYMILGSLSFGYLIMVDPRYSLFLFILLLFGLLASADRLHKMRNVIIIVMGVLIFLIPWTARQTHMFNRVVIFSPYYDTKALSYVGINDPRGEQSNDCTNGLEGGDYVSGVEPYFHRLFDYWRFARFRTDTESRSGIRYRYAWGISKNLSNILHIGLLFPFMCLGICSIIKRRQLPQLLILSFLIYHMVFHVLTCYVYRYRLPVIPVLFIVGWYGASSVARKIAERKSMKCAFLSKEGSCYPD